MKTHNIGNLVLVMSMAAALAGCASQSANKKVDTQVAQETTIKTHADLTAEAKDMIRTAPGLTDEQRAQLSALRSDTGTEMDALHEQSLKLRSVLIKDILATNYDEKEVAIVKSKIKKVENQRLKVMFSAVEKANSILGHDAQAHRDVIEKMWETQGRSRD